MLFLKQSFLKPITPKIPRTLQNYQIELNVSILNPYLVGKNKDELVVLAEDYNKIKHSEITGKLNLILKTLFGCNKEKADGVVYFRENVGKGKLFSYSITINPMQPADLTGRISVTAMINIEHKTSLNFNEIKDTIALNFPQHQCSCTDLLNASAAAEPPVVARLT